ncbi:MAG: DUF3027 domain-containing protein [Mycobacterium sp.]|nr:DUF3027 domain-containing protein [Mycobacterium sp.]
MDTPTDTADPTAGTGHSAPDEQVAALLNGAAELARQAVVEFSGETVGGYLGVAIDDEASATHRFLTTMPGYQGWQWAVVVAAYPGADHATISEVVLVPGPAALLAPPWVPWEQRVKPGDLGPGDLLAPVADDPRLVPGFLATGDPLIDDTALEVGLGRRRVLSADGRDDAAQRWHDGPYGPEAPMARATKRVCRDCGFMTPLAGALGVRFGVCCNEFAADGRVVDFFYGCGAHSDTPAPHGFGSPAYEPYDDGVLEVVEAGPASAGPSDAVAEPEAEAEAVDTEPEAEAAGTELEVEATGTEPEVEAAGTEAAGTEPEAEATGTEPGSEG